jgi:SAM-dependent methyltransferase
MDEERESPIGGYRVPAAERSRKPILDVIARVLPTSGTVLEIASGTGQHVAFFAKALPALVWQPTEIDPDTFGSITAWAEASHAWNVRPPLRLDATDELWPIDPVEAIFNANMIHIAPWDVCLGLVRGAGRYLKPGGQLILYGPFRIGGRHTARSNAAFDVDLRARDPSWGVRDLEAVVEAARAHGLVPIAEVPMPANNQTVIFKRGD